MTVLRFPSFCPKYLQPGIVRGQWNLSEDKLIVKMVSEGYMWRDIAARLPRRTGESVRARYVNHLDPTLKRSKWTKKEDKILFEAQRRVGNKWSRIRKLLSGRSDNAIKNRYHNKKKAYFRKIQKSKTEKNRKNPTNDSTKPTKKTAVDSQRSTTLPHSICLEDFPDAVASIWFLSMGLELRVERLCYTYGDPHAAGRTRLKNHHQQEAPFSSFSSSPEDYDRIRRCVD